MNRTHYYIYNIVAMLLLIGAAMPLHAQTIKGNVYGGGNLAQVVGSTKIDIKSGGITAEKDGDGNIYGGGYGASAVLTGNTTINVTGGTIAKDVYGGGALANVTGSTTVNVNGGTVTQDVYGGGALANVSANTNVNLTGGTIHDSYGGGLGSNEVAALIGGDATTTLNGSVVNGSVFGCNNLNGTPQGHAKVHVLSTTARDGAFEYHVAAVYGGGNLAAYEPTNANDFAEVLIENCENSIEYVYGGGNAAPVPATQVTIKGANAIDNAFAGGNGAGQSTDPSAPNYNPGADIGYKGFFSSGDATEYGTGIATINIQGGTIHHVYGGSNTLGYIKDHAEVNVNAAGTCTMDVAELYGGGKMAPGKAATINITCTGEEGRIENVYGGAHMADLTGDITLNINGGNIGNAFGGNNESGNINGSIHVVVDWTGSTCGKNSLDNVYGGGQDAAYTTPDDKTGPLVELINATINNNVYGGGKGETAKVTGSPIVTLEGATVGTTATIAAGTGGRIFGGGDAAPVEGNPTVTATEGSAAKIFAGGKGATAIVTGNPTAVLNKTDEKILTLTEIYGGGDAAEVTGNTIVTLTKGEVTNAFGGGNAAAINGTTAVTITNATASNVYGGGNLAGVSQTATVTMSGGNVTTGLYGGCNSEGAVTGNIAVNVTGGQIGTDAEHKANVHGGGYGSATQTAGNVAVAVNGASVVVYGDIYGGSALGNVNDNTDDNTTVTITAGTVNGDVYGGGLGDATNAALVNGNVAVNINGGTVTGNVFGCNNVNGTPKGRVAVTVANNANADLNEVYGGGNMANYEPATDQAPVVTINDCGTSINYVYGGGNAADVPATNVTVWGGTIGNVFGGGHGDKDANPATEANVTGNASVTIKGGTIEKVFAGSNSKGSIGGNASLNIAKEGACGMHITEVYGGGNQADGKAGTITIGCTGDFEHNGEGIGDVYGGANAADITNAIELTITGGHINRVFGGNNASGSITGPITVNVDWDDDPSCSKYLGDVFGGGNLANYDKATTVNMKKGTVNNIYGGGNEAGVGTATVNMSGGDVLQGLYGGCNTSGTVTGDIAVTVTNGTIGTDAGHTANVHGGGYGSATATNGNVEVTINQGAEKTVTIFGDVYGGSALGNVNDATDDNTTVTVTAGTVNGNVYGGGLGDADNAAQVNGDVLVTINGGAVNGSVFGCNNTNGTPKGHVKVHVTKTTPREGQTAGQYDVPAVYGGGNKAAYEPTSDDEYAEVLIENCDNSIEYVYGGGNAAPVPATKVKIYGANAINHAFAGGNGLGLDEGGNKVTNPESPYYNPGADVGYKDYYSIKKGSATTYGTGTASIAVYGGTVHNVYGGSNTLGYISSGSTVSAEADPSYAGTHCELNVDNVFGGGNEAPMDCGITMNINCSEGGKVLYAGANNADVNGDITLNIHSGTFEQVFCGNNQGGAVRGKLEINVEETGCTPIIIKELFGGGNLAAYSAYGYDVEGSTTTPRATLNEEWKNGEGKYIDPISNKELKSGEGYGNPTINVISCTAIGTVYGGGYGNTAVMYGNPIVNVDMVNGKWATTAINRAFNVIKDGEFFTPSTSPAIPNAIGVIGNIFGGGKEAAVYGNTTVNVCVKDADKDANIAPMNGELRNIMSFDEIGSNVSELETRIFIDYEHTNTLGRGLDLQGTTTKPTVEKIHNNTDDVNCIALEDSYSTKGDQLVLSGSFKAGDIVSLSGFYNNSSQKNAAVSIFENVDDKNATDANTSPHFINGQTSAAEPTQWSYTVKTNTDHLYIRRAGDTKTYLYNLKVTGGRYTPEDLPTGSIYGGGKLANVYGNTKVHIRNGNIEGDVFGAGQGDAAQPDAALVKGKTEVIIGEDPDD